MVAAVAAPPPLAATVTEWDKAGIVWLCVSWVMSPTGFPVLSAVATVTVLEDPVPQVVAVRVCW